MASQQTRRIMIVCCLLLPLLGAVPSSSANMQEEKFPGVRGSLYESPTYGWTMVLDPAVWTVEEASSANGVDVISLLGSNNGSVVSWALFETIPGGSNAVQDCLAAVEPRLQSIWPGAAITPAYDQYTGEIIYDLLSDYGQMAAYFVSDSPDFTGVAVAEAFCALSGTGRYIISALSVTESSRYDEGADLIERLMDTWYGSRTSEPRPDGEPPKIGVLQFQLQCARSKHVIESPYDSTYSHFYGDYPPPEEPLPSDQAYLLHGGWVANIDAIPSVLDLNQLIARFPEDAVREGANLAYSPAYYAWLYGVPDGTSESVILASGESAVYLVWYIVDRVEDKDGGPYEFSLDVTYEPLVGPPARAGQTTMIKSETHRLWECGAGGGVRPRVQLGN